MTGRVDGEAEVPPWQAPRPGRGKAKLRKSRPVTVLLTPVQREWLDRLGATVKDGPCNLARVFMLDGMERFWRQLEAEGLMTDELKVEDQPGG